MTTELQILDDYETMREDVQAIMTESVFASRWALIQGHWEVGQRIRTFKQGEVTKLLQRLASDLGYSDRTLWYCVQFYDKFPTNESLDLLPHGKTISWNKIVTQLLPDGKKPKEEHEYECPECHYKGKVGDFK